MSHPLDEALLALPPAEADALARTHARYMTADHQAGLRLFTCPICWRSMESARPPVGWLVVEPFTRVAACSTCREELNRGPKS